MDLGQQPVEHGIGHGRIDGEPNDQALSASDASAGLDQISIGTVRLTAGAELYLDQLRIYTRQLTAAEVGAICRDPAALLRPAIRCPRRAELVGAAQWIAGLQPALPPAWSAPVGIGY